MRDCSKNMKEIRNFNINSIISGLNIHSSYYTILKIIIYYTHIVKRN